MKKLYFIFPLLMATNCFSQADRKLSTFLAFQVHHTLYDWTIQNNKGGFGLALQTHLNTKTPVRPMLEINADFFMGNKIAYLTTDGKFIDGKSGVMGVYAGPQLQLKERVLIAATMGASLFHGQPHFGIRPSLASYLGANKRWMAKASFTNVFQGNDFSHEDFGYISFALGLRLY
ncbi:MAG TPA: hypothetical protein VEB42_08030 [Chitinophagaceae bacterium]|nr:hypothetical protein [Chitinophagaceae bacterium]